MWSQRAWFWHGPLLLQILAPCPTGSLTLIQLHDLSNPQFLWSVKWAYQHYQPQRVVFKILGTPNIFLRAKHGVLKVLMDFLKRNFLCGVLGESYLDASLRLLLLLS